MTIALIVILLIFVLYLLSLCGRTGHKKLNVLKKYHYAHRGLHGNGVPENSMQAFAAAKEHGYGIELDLHLLKDGSLAVFHDNTLNRTTGLDGRPEELCKDDLKSIYLEGTSETIPEFSQVLELYDGAAPLVVELKPVGKNHAELARAACDALKDYKGDYCIECFDPRCLLWLKNNRPDIVRGQLSQNFFKSKDKLSLPIKFVMTNLLTNFLTQPDFVAYNFLHRKSAISVSICKNLWRMQCVGWTIRSADTQKQVEDENWLSIFEYFKP